MQHLYSYYLTVGLLFWIIPAFAQQEDTFEQPIQEFNFTQAVYSQAKREVQFTLTGFASQSTYLRDLNLGLSVEYGITDRFQVEAEFMDTVVKPRNIDEASSSEYRMSTGVLYNLVNRAGFSSSLALEAALPFRTETGDEIIEYEPHIILAKQVGKGQLHLDVGAEVQAAEKEYFTNLALLYPLGNIKPIFELNGSYEDKYHLFVSPGLVWNKQGAFELITGATFGMWQRSRPWGLNLKLVYEFTVGADQDN